MILVFVVVRDTEEHVNDIELLCFDLLDLDLSLCIILYSIR